MLSGLRSRGDTEMGRWDLAGTGPHAHMPTGQRRSEEGFGVIRCKLLHLEGIDVTVQCPPLSGLFSSVDVAQSLCVPGAPCVPGAL